MNNNYFLLLFLLFSLISYIDNVQLNQIFWLIFLALLGLSILSGKIDVLKDLASVYLVILLYLSSYIISGLSGTDLSSSLSIIIKIIFLFLFILVIVSTEPFKVTKFIKIYIFLIFSMHIIALLLLYYQYYTGIESSYQTFKGFALINGYNLNSIMLIFFSLFIFVDIFVEDLWSDFLRFATDC